jgi:hypothetical protein
MNTLEEAKEIMNAAGCIKAFPVYDLKLSDIAEVKSCNEKGESIELEKNINKLVQTFSKEIILNIEKPIVCPIDQSLNKYLEFSLKNRLIAPYNLDVVEYKKIECKIGFLLERYNWIIKNKS